MQRLLKFTLDLFAPTAPVFSRHPDSSQQTNINGQLIDYQLQRSRRRTMIFSVSAEGLTVRAPYGMPMHTVEQAVQEKGLWIVRKLDGMKERQARIDTSRINWLEAPKLDFLGQKITVIVAPNESCTRYQPNNNLNDMPSLLLAIPTHAQVKKIRDTTQQWMKEQATVLYTERLNHFAKQLGVTWKSLHLSNANTRWGSAKADGSIRLHWRLIQFRPEVIDYVVVHELSHLRELNHSPRFWAIVGSVFPEYLAVEKKLKHAVLPPWE
ncbi:MAG TPA: SprT family zinc-dependent metalloprotease [Burkholderiaceae bacterium]|nr:SprT family zinc-dependent metalloprotease [Burkholderiaceae bacterium]